jgi:hypothetical protein
MPRVNHHKIDPFAAGLRNPPRRESQQSRLSDQTTSAAKRAWRSDDVPEKFWDSYVEDARAALSLTSIAGARTVSD